MLFWNHLKDPLQMASNKAAKTKGDIPRLCIDHVALCPEGFVKKTH